MAFFYCLFFYFSWISGEIWRPDVNAWQSRILHVHGKARGVIRELKRSDNQTNVNKCAQGSEKRDLVSLRRFHAITLSKPKVSFTFQRKSHACDHKQKCGLEFWWHCTYLCLMAVLMLEFELPEYLWPKPKTMKPLRQFWRFFPVPGSLFWNGCPLSGPSESISVWWQWHPGCSDASFIVSNSNFDCCGFQKFEASPFWWSFNSVGR